MIHNISISTANDATYFGDDVNIYPVYLPSAITLEQLPLEDAVLIGKKGPLFPTIFLSICCKLIWELTHGH